jgi:transposase
MLGIGPAAKVFVVTGAVDMRKGFEGLFGLVRDVLGCEPLSGHLLLCASRARTRVTILFWDGSGLWVCAKRLEKGRFYWPEASEGQVSVAMRQEELTMLMAGLDLGQAKPRQGWLRMDKAS